MSNVCRDVAEADPILVDRIARTIRVVDSSHTMFAGELAGHIAALFVEARGPSGTIYCTRTEPVYVLYGEPLELGLPGPS